MLYAVLNENNKCIYVADFTTGEQNFIKIDENANSMFFIGKYYDSEKNIFYEKPQLDKIEEQVYSNNDNDIIIMEAIADQYEQTEEYRLNDMEVQATIFESVLALSEGGTTV